MDSPSAMMDVDLSIDRHLHDFRPSSMIESESSSSTLSNSDIFLEKSTKEQYEKDILERLFYRTTQDESKTTLTFISHVFFNMFLSKMKSDFVSSIDIDETSTVSKCVTHIKGLKCDILLDSHFCTVSVTGVGHRIWRDYYFSKAARSLIRRHLQEGSQDNELIESPYMPSSQELSTESSSSSLMSGEESNTDASSSESSSNSSNVSSEVSHTEDIQILSGINCIRPLHVSTPNAQSSILNPKEGGNEGITLQRIQLNKLAEDNSGLAEDNSGLVLRQHGESQSSNGRQLSLLISKAGKMETELRGLKHTVINMMENLTKPRLYAKTVSDASVERVSQAQSQSVSPESTVDHIRKTGTSNTPQDVSINFQPNSSYEIPQSIPVIITHGNNTRHPQTVNRKPDIPRTNPGNNETHKRVLLLGDSIIGGINTKGLTETHKHSNSGGTIQNVIEEIRFYDLKVFSTVIVYTGGNNVARGDNLRSTEEKYDELISLIKCGNSLCRVILCDVAPRRDMDVQRVNQAIERVATHWNSQKVKHGTGTHGLFLKDGQYSTRYYHNDGIHLSTSGTKRLLDALNRVLPFVKDFDSCVFNRKGNVNRPNTNFGPRSSFHSFQGQGGNRSWFGRNRMICFGCSKVGHKIADCWYQK